MIEKRGSGSRKRRSGVIFLTLKVAHAGEGGTEDAGGGMWIWRERRGKRDERIGGRGGQEEVERIDEEGFGRKI